MGYLPQFIAGDATPLGKSLVTATPTQSAARDLIGLGEGDRPTFRGLVVDAIDAEGQQSVLINTSTSLRINTQSANGIDIWAYSDTGWRQPTIRLYRQKGTLENPLPVTAGIGVGRITFGSNSAAIEARAAEVWDGDGRGTHLRFSTTPIGSPVTEETTRLQIFESGKVIIGAPYTNDGEPNLLQVNGSTLVGSLYGNGGTLAIRNGTNAQSLLLTKTYTSDTNYAGLQLDTADAAYRIGSAVGSAGGVNRNLELGRWQADGTFFPRMIISTGTVNVYGSNAVETARFTADNRLGIGVTTPAKRVEVSTQQDDDGLLIRRDSEDDHSYASLLFGAATTPQAKAGILFQRTPGHKGRGTLHFCMYDGAGNDIFVTPADARLSITRQGYVGIGITEPSARLHVVGGVSLEGLPTSDPSVANRLWNNGNVLSLSGEANPTFSGLLAIGRVVATAGFRITDDSRQQQAVSVERDGVTLNSAAAFRWGDRYAGGGWHGPPSLELWRDNSDILAQRRETNPQRYRLYKTFTSGTNFERLQFDTTADAYRIGSSIGSAGGTNRNIQLGRYSGDGSWLPAMTIRNNGNVGIGSTNPSYPFIVVPSAENGGWVAVDSFGNNQPGFRLQTATIHRSSSGGIVINESVGGSGGVLRVQGKLMVGGTTPTIGLGSGVESAQIETSWNTADTNVKIRNAGTKSTSLRIVGGLCVGTAYENTAPPTDGAIIEGRLGVGISSPATPLHVIGAITLDNLPTSDPAIAGQVWNDNGTLKISAG